MIVSVTCRTYLRVLLLLLRSRGHSRDFFSEVPNFYILSSWTTYRCKYGSFLSFKALLLTKWLITFLPFTSIRGFLCILIMKLIEQRALILIDLFIYNNCFTNILYSTTFDFDFCPFRYLVDCRSCVYAKDTLRVSLVYAISCSFFRPLQVAHEHLAALVRTNI